MVRQCLRISACVAYVSLSAYGNLARATRPSVFGQLHGQSPTPPLRGVAIFVARSVRAQPTQATPRWTLPRDHVTSCEHRLGGSLDMSVPQAAPPANATIESLTELPTVRVAARHRFASYGRVLLSHSIRVGSSGLFRCPVLKTADQNKPRLYDAKFGQHITYTTTFKNSTQMPAWMRVFLCWSFDD